jgi:hypothetical protein
MSNGTKRSQFLIGLTGVGLFFLLSGFVLSEDPVAQSQWAASPLHLDGLAEEWASDSLLHIEKIDLDCGFKNDGRNFYILLVFREPKTLSSIDSVGITIRGSRKGVAGKNNGVKFVKRILTADQYISMLESQGSHLTASDKEGLRNWPQHFVFAVYAVDKKGKIIPATGSATDFEPPEFRTRRQQNLSIYEFRLPLAFRESYPAGIEAEPGTMVSVSFEWGGSGRKTLSPKTSWSTPWSIVSGSAIADNDETRAQEFLNSFDSMSRPSLETKKYSFRVDVQLAKPDAIPET